MEKNNGGSISIKLPRSDSEKTLPNNFREQLIEYLAKYDVFSNSISNLDLARIIAKYAQKGCYFLSTKYLGSGTEAFNELVKRADGIFFSGREFYWLKGKEAETKWGGTEERGLRISDVKGLANDIVSFVKEKMPAKRGIFFKTRHIGFVCVSLGRWRCGLSK